MQKYLVRAAACLAGVVGLYGCSGGGGGGGGNSAPTAAFSASPGTGAAPLTVNFDASASSDSDGTIAGYSWDFGDSSAAGSGVTTSHDYTTAGTFTVTLTVTDNDGSADTATQTITVTGGPPPPPIALSGKITYDRVPFDNNGPGLDYAAIFQAPARGIVVELLRPDGTVVASTITGSDGRYQFNAPANTDLFVRARARLARTSTGAGQPGWDIRVRDNTNGNAQYVMDGAVQNTGNAAQTRNLNADSGWPGFGGTTYSGPRVAAPFAILDTIYDAVRFVIEQGDPGQVFEPLNVYWSPDNRPVAGDDDFSDGQIGSTFYRSQAGTGSPVGIYVLGDDGVDTDEYDTHVLTHEFMHFIEYTVSRSDAVGGAHLAGDLLDMRVAFSEGFGDAFSGMALNDPLYRDSNGASQGDEFNFNLEDNSWMNPGWFSEGSIGSIVWDLFDSHNDGPDTTSVPFSAMYDVERSELRNGPALTSLFVFVSALKTRAGIDVAAVNSIVAGQSIVASTMDAYATTETHDGGIPEALPVYTSVAVNGSTKQVCGRADGKLDQVYNTLGNRRFLRFSLASDSSNLQIRVVALGTAGIDYPAPDPDLILYSSGFLDFSDCAGPDGGGCTEPQNTEVLERPLPAGDYVLEVYDYSNIDPTNGVRPSTCMNVSITG